MSVVLPIPSLRRGACPTLDQPMPTGDGLLARIRIAGGRIDPVRLEQLAILASSFGNGMVEITSRGNLQMRGLTDSVVPAFARQVRQIVAVESGLVVETPPLAGDDPLEFTDPRPLASAIRAFAAPLAGGFAPKATVVVDGNGQIGLEALKADLRLVAVAADRWLVSAGTTLLGTTTQPLDCARIVLSALLALGSGARATQLDLPGLLQTLGDRVEPSAPVHQPITSPVGRFSLRSGSATGLALPFGALPWESLAALADGAWRFGIGEFRLGPQHSLLAINADESLLEEVAAIGFITDPRDPRFRVSACIGNRGCAAGHVDARAVASRLAPTLPPLSTLHVSGCAKGCAHPTAADITLVGQPNGYGLVIGGKAGDTPRAVLRADQLATALVAGRG